MVLPVLLIPAFDSLDETSAVFLFVVLNAHSKLLRLIRDRAAMFPLSCFYSDNLPTSMRCFGYPEVNSMLFAQICSSILFAPRAL